MRRVALALAMLCASFTSGHAQTQAEQAASLTRMPVKEVTIFKDGHAFVVHEGRVPTDARGLVVLNRLPAAERAVPDLDAGQRQRHSAFSDRVAR